MLALEGQHRGWAKVAFGKVFPLSVSSFLTFGIVPSEAGSWSSVNKNMMFGLPWTACAGSTFVITNNSSTARIVATATADNLKVFAISCLTP